MLAGDITAVEVNGARARELEETTRRLGSSNVRVVVADGRALPPELEGFDRALVDAPCSGLGVLNRRPDLRWRAEPLPELQLELLRAAAQRVRRGGSIVYSVCTVNADESEAVVDASGLEVDPSLGDEWPQFRHASRPEFLQTLPHVHGTAGFFVARLRRVRVPSALEWWRGVAGGAEWLDSLPGIVEACAEQWSLLVANPYEGGNVSFVVAVERDGVPAVLKVNFPEEETEREPDALAHWGGRGAVRLLEYDAPRRALLIERCQPGTRLWDIEDDDESTRIAAAVLAVLWRPPRAGHGFTSLASAAARWALELPRDWEALGRPFEREILDEAVATCIDLGSDQGAAVVLHQDFHGGNRPARRARALARHRSEAARGRA